jgi:hypothetical protein
MRLRKILIKVSVVLLVFLTAVLALRAFLNYTAGKRLEDYLVKAKAEGVALGVREFVPDCTESENAAPLWKAAEALLAADGEDKSALSKALADSFYERPLDDESRRRLARIIEKNRRSLDLTIEAAARPCLRLGFWSQAPDDAFKVNVPSLVKMVLATKLLAVEALLRADRGETQQALDECRNGMRLARRIMDEPALITTLIAVADMKQMLISFDRIVSGRNIDQETVASWIKELDHQSWRSSFIRALPAEQANSLEVGLRMIKGDPAATKSYSGPEGLNSRFWSWLIRPLLKSELLWFQKSFEGAGKVSMLPYYEQREFLIAQSGKVNPPPWYYRMIGGLQPNFHASFLREASLEAMMLATRAGLACKIYRNKTGHYPENLEALVPDILPEIPIDPFTGKPLVFKRQSGKLLIYSLGSNQKDDGGRSTYMITQLVMEKDDDWTWREKIK